MYGAHRDVIGMFGGRAGGDDKVDDAGRQHARFDAAALALWLIVDCGERLLDALPKWVLSGRVHRSVVFMGLFGDGLAQSLAFIIQFVNDCII